MNKKTETIESIKKAVAEKKAQQKNDNKNNTKKPVQKKEAIKEAITFGTVKKALNNVDKRFTVYDDMQVNDRANYCSLRLILKDKSIDTRKVFCIYYNAASVTIHCAARFESVCADYRLNKKRTEYTKTVSLDELAEAVNTLLADEIARLQMKETTASKKAQPAAK